MIDRKINILFVIPSLRIGGAERQLIDLVNGISKERFNVHLFTFEKHLDLLEDLRKEIIAFYNYPRQHKYDTSPIKKITQVLDKEKIDIIHCTLEIAFLFGFVGKLRAKKKPKCVCALHTTINKNFKGDLYDMFLYAPLMYFCDSVITVCQNQRIHWSRKYPFLANKFVTIHNGIDTNKFMDTFSNEEKKIIKESLGIQEDEFVAAIVASLDRKKGHDYAFKALKALGGARKKIKLLIVGDGERKDYLQQLAEKMSVSKHLIWLGYQHDPRKFLSISDVLLVPSLAESFPMSILEALSMGKPVIASRVGGISEVIRDGVNGFLTRPKDVLSLAEDVKKIAHNDKIRRELSKNARETIIDKFSAIKMVEKTEELFVELML